MSVRSISGRVVALIAALLAVIATCVAPALAQESATDFDTWSDIATSITTQLKDAQQKYQDGNHAGSASTFSKALNTGYIASNFATAVSETIDEQTYTSQRSQLQSLAQLAYKQDKQSDIDSTVSKVSDDLAKSAATLDANTSLAKPREYAAARSAKTQSEREQLDAAKVNKNTGKGDRTWSDVAEEMNTVLDEALASAQSGDTRAGADGVNNAYYQYYEKLGFEKNVMNAIGGDRVSKVESTFKNIRKTMMNGEDATSLVTSLKQMLTEDATQLDGGAANSVNGFTKFVTSSIGQAFLVLIREGLEALLVVAAIIAYLVKSNNRRYVKWIYVGVLVGLIGSGIVAVILGLLFGGSGPQQEIMEGICALIAMGMLLWTSNWMLNKSSVEAWNRYIRTKTEAAVAAASDTTAEKTTVDTIASLALLSFLAVFREGAETVIFYESIYSMTNDSRGMWIGGIAAAVVLIIIFLIIRFTSVKIPIGPFFLVTSILMSLLVIIFAGGGVHSLIEGDLLPGMYVEGLPTNDWLGFYPYVETVVAQIIAALAVIGLFVVGTIKQRKAKEAVTQ